MPLSYHLATLWYTTPVSGFPEVIVILEFVTDTFVYKQTIVVPLLYVILTRIATQTQEQNKTMYYI